MSVLLEMGRLKSHTAMQGVCVCGWVSNYDATAAQPVQKGIAGVAGQRRLLEPELNLVLQDTQEPYELASGPASVSNVG